MRIGLNGNLYSLPDKIDLYFITSAVHKVISVSTGFQNNLARDKDADLYTIR